MLKRFRRRLLYGVGRAVAALWALLPLQVGLALGRGLGAALHALDQAAFASAAGSQPSSRAAFIEEHVQARDLDPALSLVAE